MEANIKKKVRIIDKAMESIRKSDNSLHTISFHRVAEELNMPFEELKDFFLNIEEVFLNEQRRVNLKLEKFIEKGLEEAKTPNQFKELLENLTTEFINRLPDHADLVLSASFYLPKCLEERRRAKKYYRSVFRKIINKGWPGKIDTVLERQTDLLLLSAYGLYEYCARAGKSERKAIRKDFINMINLHLQDRLFF